MLLALALSATGGCAAVHPWERGLLAKQKMQIEPDPLSSLHEQHVYEYREGSSGGYAAGGGGCGCN